MLIFPLFTLSLQIPPSSNLHHCLICSIPKEGDSPGQLRLRFDQWEGQSGYWRAGHERCGCLSSTTLLFSSICLVVAEYLSIYSSQQAAPLMVPALTSDSNSVFITPLPLTPPDLFRPKGNNNSLRWLARGAPASLVGPLNLPIPLRSPSIKVSSHGLSDLIFFPGF